jgi:hypothetical protein
MPSLPKHLAAMLQWFYATATTTKKQYVVEINMHKCNTCDAVKGDASAETELYA